MNALHMPSRDGASTDLPANAAGLVRAENMVVHFPRARRGLFAPPPPPMVAVNDVSFDIARGETLGMVGESGSGKSTIGRALLGRQALTSGRVLFKGRDLAGLSRGERRAITREIQPVFQDPFASLNPRMSVGDIVAEPLIVHGIAEGREARARVAELLEMVGLPATAAARHPGSFSGGQRQRIGIARAIAAGPEFIVADEPVSALDVSIRAQITNLFRDLQGRLGIAFLFIGHDMAVVRYVSHRIAVVYAGRVVELAPRDEIYRRPKHPYTRALLDAVPVPDPARRGERKSVLRGEPGAIGATGCSFAPRCPLATQQCRELSPPYAAKGSGRHFAACWRSDEVSP
jgi:peptide/nickel transport system ATP-binding protein